MAEPPVPPARTTTAWTPLIVSLSVVLLLGTVGSAGVGFGVMTACTDDFSCTTTACEPCAATRDWLARGWIGQGLLLLLGLGLAVQAARRTRVRAVRRAALALAPISVALIVATTVLAAGSH